VLVTGCSTGIGRATALRLAGAGWRVYASARRIESIEALGAEGCELLELDVANEASRREAVATIEERDGFVAALVNNAGYSQSGAVESVPLDRVRRQFETNVFGPLELCRLVLPGMRRERRGRIVNVSSMGGRLTFPGAAAYHASKYALEAFSDVLRFEVAAFGIQVVLVEPGIIRTEFSATAAGELAESSPDEGPYVGFDAYVAATTVNAYERGLMARLGGEPASVARAIERALGARRPRTRYLVTPSARLMVGLHGLLPDRLWDRMLASSYPHPGAA
jgi:NAD(P)-dependent dehydrogenase (short-subunit alcohol dehydrogenase family)